MDSRTGKCILLSVRPGASLRWIVPLWAIVWGAIVGGSGAILWTDVVRLLLVLILVEIGWGELWRALTATDWATPLRRWQHWHLGASPSRAFWLPYTRPGSPAHRFALWLGQLASWGGTIFLPVTGPFLAVAFVGTVLSLALAAALGREMLLLTLGVLAYAQLATVVSGGRGEVGVGWNAAVRVGLPYLAGHLAFAPLTLPSLILAATFSFAFSGAEGRRSTRHLALWVGGYLVAAALLLVLRRPLAVPFLLFLGLPPLLTEGHGARGWFRRYGAWWMAALALTSAVV